MGLRVLLFVSFLLAQAAPFHAAVFAGEGEPPDLQQTTAGYYRYLPARSVEAHSGEVEIFATAGEYSCDFKAFDKLPVTFTLEQEYVAIDDTLADVELPSHLVSLAADIETTVPFFGVEKTYLRMGVSPSFYGDDWDFSTSSFRIPLRAFAIHVPNERWTFLAGIAVYPDFEDEVVPILGFIYKPNQRLTFNIVPKRPNISFVLNQKVTLFAEGGGSLGSEYEVDRDGQEGVVLSYKELRLGGGLKFRLSPRIQGSLSCGGAFNRQFKYQDYRGKVNIKDGLYSEFRLQIQL